MQRVIHIANEKKRDAQVTFDAQPEKHKIRMILSDGKDKINVKMIKSTISTAIDTLTNQYSDLKELANVLIDSDPEVDMEIAGKRLNRTHKLYVDKDNKIAYRINLSRIIYNPDGTVNERRDVNKLASNVNAQNPLKWTGKKFLKDEIIRQFVFTHKYQLSHINGVTFDFLYNMAKDLQDSNSMLLLGGGSKGNEPILLTRGGQPYRGFLEGRIMEDKYMLILHLTDIELKEPEDEAE